MEITSFTHRSNILILRKHDIMTTYLKDLIHIPERVHKGDFVLSLAEGVQRPEKTLDDYVVTAQLQECFKDALGVVKEALESDKSKITYLHGSFGSGKSHFMAVLDFILSNHKMARAKKDLQEVCSENLWTENYKLLMVPYHMIGAESMEQAILGQYARFIKKTHPDAPPPAIYLADGLFKDAANMRENYGDEKFFEVLNGGSQGDDDGFGDYDIGWDAESYQQAVDAATANPERLRLVSDLVTHHFKNYAHVTSGRAEAFLPLDQGLAVMSQHAKQLGYDGVILFLDELVLWLASRAADISFVHQEGQKLAKLVEAQEANRPVPLISFVARQKKLSELVGENITGSEQNAYEDALQHWSGRFHEIKLEDINLPDIVAGRVLRPSNATAGDQIDAAFARTSKVRSDVMDVLLTSRGNRDMFRKVYPFSPALVETLVAASSLLQRNRTAIKALMELLVKQRDYLELGTVIPVGDLFDIVAQGDEVFTQSLREHFNNAKRLYQDRFRPMLEAEHHVQEEDVEKAQEKGTVSAEQLRFINDARLVKTLLLSALVPRVECFQALTAQRLAALNHGTIKTPLPGQEASIVLKKLKKWAATIGELRISDGDNPTVSLQLVGVDTERILENSRHMDNSGNRKRKTRQLLSNATGIKNEDLMNNYIVLWRGTEREFPVEFANVREKTSDSLRHAGDGWKLLIDFPFDDQEFGPKDDIAKLEHFRQTDKSSKTLVWLPKFLSSKVQNELGRLIMLDHVLTGDNFTEATKHLTPQDVPQARNLLESQQSALTNRLIADLEMAYGVRKAEDDVINNALSLELSEQFQSLWAGFKPVPPVGKDLRGALEDLLAQTLAHEYPGHPDFQLENKLSKNQVQSVWTELARLPEVGGERLEVDKKLRERVKRIAEPLKLGQMAETHFVPSRHWLDLFDRKMSLENRQEPSVADLDTWMDDPNPTGLPNFLRDLVILSFASRTNRSFQVQGVNHQPRIGELRREALLVRQPLPDAAEWEKARDLMRRLLGVESSRLLNADTVSRFADQTQQRAHAYKDACQELPGLLSESLTKLGLDTSQSQRLAAAREVRSVLQTAVKQDKPKALIEALAALQLECSEEELAASLKSAEKTKKALETARLDVFDLLAQKPVQEAKAVRQQLEEAFQEHEFHGSLALQLSQCTDQAWKIVNRPDPKPDPGPAPRPLQPPPEVKVIGKKTLDKIDPEEAKKELAELTTLLTAGRKLSISWTVWED
jgi:hypothetical protein